ncbi:MAG TPA: hypothetical protein ENF95_01935, partial [Candidatus Aenigmarchaeota archaeon]|nr:hypothetical protein [Candidatus Aenigmarchaeota archaeon]
MKPLLTLLVTFLILVPVCRADVIANSYDWRDVYTVAIYSHYRGEDFHFVNSLGEAKILSMTLNKSKGHVIFESSSNSVVKNLQNFLNLRGFEKISSENFGDYKDLQFTLFGKLNNLKGFVVINDEFGYDAISVAPYALTHDYWVLFYNPDTKKRVIDLLNSHPDLPVIFYGEFLDRPWKKVKNTYNIIDEKNFFKNNMAILSLYVKESSVSNPWLIVTSGTYLDEGYILEKMPIAFTKENVEELINFLKASGINTVEIIGPESVNYGQLIREKSNRTIGVVARIGRTFTGASELRGKSFVLRTIPVDVPELNLKVENVYFDTINKILILNITNKGNIDTYYYLNGMGLFYGRREIFPEFNTSMHVLPKHYSFSLPIKLNVSQPPERIELLGLYGYEFPLENYFDSKPYNVTPIELRDNSDLKIVSVWYDATSEKFKISLKNLGSAPVWAYGEITNFYLMGLNRTFFFKGIEIKPQETKELSLDVHLEEEDLKANKDLKVTIYYGKDKD